MNEIIEEWKPICGYEGLYEVSSLGRVKSLRDNNGNPREKILKFGKKPNGYLQCELYKNGKGKNFIIHRLVATAFIQNPNNYQTVNHIDENKENNCVNNLEWMDMKQQINHGTCIQRRVEKQKNDPKKSKQVYQYSKNGELIKIWQSVNECGRNGYLNSNVSNCCLGKQKSHKGYIWSYILL